MRPSVEREINKRLATQFTKYRLLIFYDKNRGINIATKFLAKDFEDR